MPNYGSPKTNIYIYIYIFKKQETKTIILIHLDFF